MSKTNKNFGDELTIDELNAVSGGSLPLPAIVATIVRSLVGSVGSGGGDIQLNIPTQVGVAPT